MHMCRGKRNKLWTYYFEGCTLVAAAWTRGAMCAMASILTPLERRICQTTVHLASFRSRFGGLLSRPLKCTALRVSCSKMHLYDHQAFAHSTTVQPPSLHLLCPWGNDIDYIRKLITLGELRGELLRGCSFMRGRGHSRHNMITKSLVSMHTHLAGGSPGISPPP